jgi:hypothetical protein
LESGDSVKTDDILECHGFHPSDPDTKMPDHIFRRAPLFQYWRANRERGRHAQPS